MKKKPAKKAAKKAAKKSNLDKYIDKSLREIKKGKAKSAIDGKFVSAKVAKDNPKTTYKVKAKKSPSKGMNFGQALEALKKGKTVSRAAWRIYAPLVKLQRPDLNSKMTEPYLYMEKTVPFSSIVKRFPLDLSCESVLANDWLIKK